MPQDIRVMLLTTYKYVYDAAGHVLSKTFITRSTYRVQNKVILVPVGTLSTPSPSDPGTTDPGTTDSGTTDSGTPDVSPSGTPPLPSERRRPKVRLNRRRRHRAPEQNNYQIAQKHLQRSILALLTFFTLFSADTSPYAGRPLCREAQIRLING